MRPIFFDDPRFQEIYRLALTNVSYLAGITWDPMDMEDMPEFDAYGIQAWIEEIALRDAISEYNFLYTNPFIDPKEDHHG